MYSGERHIDTGEAMHHNNEVEQARRAEHLRRCAESPAYKRVYERWQKTIARMQTEQAREINIMRAAMQQQVITNIADNCDVQPVHIGRPCPLPPPSEQEQLAPSGGAFGAFVFASLFMTKEQWEQIPENLQAMEEMRKVDEEYDRQIICLSGFEW